MNLAVQQPPPVKTEQLNPAEFWPQLLIILAGALLLSGTVQLLL